MKDQYGRTVDYLRLSVTDLCNYRCRYCMPPEGVEKLPHSSILSLEEYVEIAAAAVGLGITKIRVTGGEPLVRRGIVELCRALRAIPGLRELCLTTNGSQLTALATPLHPEHFRAMTRTGSLEDVLSGIQAAERAGFKQLKLDTVLIGGFNDNEIRPLAELTLTHPWEVRFIELMPMGPCAGWDKACFLPADTVLARLPELKALPPEGVARRFRLPGAVGTVGLIAPLSHEFCGDCRRIRVTADGRLKGCLHSREEISLRGLHGPALKDALRRGIFQKPRGHCLTEGPSGTPRTMNEIGG